MEIIEFDIQKSQIPDQDNPELDLLYAAKFAKALAV